MICMIKKAQQELAAAFLWNLPYHLWHTHAVKHREVAWTCKRFLSFTSYIQKLSLKYFHFSSFFSKPLLSQVNSGSCARWNSEAGNICSVTTLDKLFQVFFQFLEDAKASRNHHTSLLNPTELGNQRLQILNYCSPHPTKTGYYRPCKQAGNGGTEWLSDYSSITTQVWESQELNLYFLHLSLRLSVLFCVAALILSRRGRLGSLKSLSLLLWLTGDVANGIGIVAFPTSKGGTQCDICLLEETLTIQVLKNINIYLIWYKRNGIWTFVFEQ